MMEVQKVLAATDFSTNAQSAIELATKLAGDFDASLVIAHVKATPEVPGVDDDVYDPTEDVEKHKLETIKPDVKGITYQHHYSHGRPSEQILLIADQEGVDLIVIGTHGETNSPEVPLGAVAEAILKHASCWVITVKRPVAHAADA
jgi:nucleotide-binding universal stress UspA family protein